MFVLVLFQLLICLNYWVNLSSCQCRDINGNSIDSGIHFVPGPDACKLCVCDYRQPKYCKDVLCVQPPDCTAFRRGKDCCEFICLDDELPKHNTYNKNDGKDNSRELALRIIACAATALLFIFIAVVLIYRIRNRKPTRRHTHHQHDDQRSLASIGVGYMGSAEGSSHSWKPHYFPRGEAPPPYDEAVAQARAEYLRDERPNLLHRSLSVGQTQRSQETHPYVNIPRPLTQVPNHRAISQARNIQPTAPSIGNISNEETDLTTYTAYHIRHHPETINLNNNIGLASSSLGTITNRGLITLVPNANDMRTLSMERKRYTIHHPFTTTIGPLVSHRTVPRTSLISETGSQNPTFYLSTQHKSHPRFQRLLQLENLHNSVNVADASKLIDGDTTRSSDNLNFNEPTLTKQIDKPQCGCSYSCQSHSDEQEDYHSECENCKSTDVLQSRWRSEESTWEETGTQSLQRHTPTINNNFTLSNSNNTLPVQKPRPPEPIPNWENWFLTIPGSSSSEED